ncbi:MAG TPA: ABC transporter permease [Vicinamibacterales bacterium]|nr:ABC transporter permease [Vicinamibacterales bacterium]
MTAGRGEPPRRRTGRTREFGANLRSLLGWRRSSDDVREELRIHAEMQAADGRVPSPHDRRALVAAGAALLDDGDRRSRRLQWIEEAWHDLRHGWRTLWARPGFALGSILTIGIGLGANTAIFGLVNAVYFRPLPIDPDGRLVRIREFSLAPDGSRRQVDASRRVFDAVTAADGLVSDAVILNGTSLNLQAGDGAQRVQATRTSAGFARVLNAMPALGRPFTAEEEREGESSGALIISHGLWARVFGSASDILGRKVVAGTRTLTIVGVMPKGFEFPYGSEAWVPARFAENERSLVIFGHLAPGLSLDAANARFEAIGRQLNAELGVNALGLGLNAVSARQALMDDDGRMAVALLGSVTFLLLIACANVTMLMTSRLVARQKEVVIRASLGCGRWRQIRQFIAEALQLFVLGGITGWGLALVIKDALVVLLPRTFFEQLGMTSVVLDLRVATVAIALAMTAGLSFGLLAAVRATRGDLNAVMKDGGRAATAGRSRRSAGALVVIEIALALVLVAGAGLLIESVYAISQRDNGFRADGLLTFQMEFRGDRYAAGGPRVQFLDAALARLRALPGVVDAGVTTVNPFCCGDWGARMSAEGQPPVAPEAAVVVQHFLVTPTFFSTMQIPLREGRLFTDMDREGQPPVVVVDERFARRFWPDQSAIGKRVKRGLYDSPFPWMTVVGVVAPIDAAGEYTEMWYLPFKQLPLGPSSTSAHVMLRSAGDPMAILPAARRAIAETDALMPVFRPTTMAELGRDRYTQDRLAATITGTLAASGLLLSVLGVYGLMSSAVAGDAREIGIRLALGASRRRVIGGVIARALRLAVIGVLAGVPLAYLSTRGLSALITDLEPLDVSRLFAVALVLVAAVATAALLPARRAMRIDPLRALRY